jgi:hypothetical protein
MLRQAVRALDPTRPPPERSIMPLQNRVTPFGEIVATPARGTLMGNRGGKFHREDKTLGKRRWSSRHWICCELSYKDKYYEPMGKGWTALFFLDEVTALAAGHRPCFYCRRQEAKRFLGLALPPLMAGEADRILHEERRASRKSADAPLRPCRIADLPDGAMVALDGEAYALRGKHLLRWSFDGYADALPRKSQTRAELITPPLFVTILGRGYEPRWHESAERVASRR